MALLPLLLIGAGTGLAAYGQYEQARAAKEAGEAEEAIAEYNARVREQQAKAAEESARIEAQRHEREAERLLGKQVARYGRAGVLMEGTPADVLAETATELEWDELMILREGALRGAELRSGATIARMRGQAAAERGRSRYRAGLFAMGGTLATGAYKMSKVWPAKTEPAGEASTLTTR